MTLFQDIAARFSTRVSVASIAAILAAGEVSGAATYAVVRDTIFAAGRRDAVIEELGPELEKFLPRLASLAPWTPEGVAAMSLEYDGFDATYRAAVAEFFRLRDALAPMVAREIAAVITSGRPTYPAYIRLGLLTNFLAENPFEDLATAREQRGVRKTYAADKFLRAIRIQNGIATFEMAARDPQFKIGPELLDGAEIHAQEFRQSGVRMLNYAPLAIFLFRDNFSDIQELKGALINFDVPLLSVPFHKDVDLHKRSPLQQVMHDYLHFQAVLEEDLASYKFHAARYSESDPAIVSSRSFMTLADVVAAYKREVERRQDVYKHFLTGLDGEKRREAEFVLTSLVWELQQPFPRHFDALSLIKVVHRFTDKFLRGEAINALKRQDESASDEKVVRWMELYSDAVNGPAFSCLAANEAGSLLPYQR